MRELYHLRKSVRYITILSLEVQVSPTCALWLNHLPSHSSILSECKDANSIRAFETKEGKDDAFVCSRLDRVNVAKNDLDIARGTFRRRPRKSHKQGAK